MVRLASALLILTAARAARVENEGASEKQDAEDKVSGKASQGDQVNIRITFNSSVSLHGNNIGTLDVQFPSGGQLSTQGFFRGHPPRQWSHGAILGKSDNFAWPIQPMGTAYAFDHGVSDLIFGDATSGGHAFFRPEFDELVYSRQAGANYQGYNQAYAASPQQAVNKILREEQKESSITLGQWSPDGYFTKGYSSMCRYDPKLKVKDASGGFNAVKKGSSFTVATLLRPSVLDIDNLFAVKPTVPSSFRSSMEVQNDYGYMGNGYGQQPGYQPGVNANNQPFNPHSGGPQPGQPYLPHGGQPGYVGGHQMQCFHKSGISQTLMGMVGKSCQGRNQRCATQDQCREWGGRWKNKYCSGPRGCGCCKEIGRHRGASLAQLEDNSTQAGVTAGGSEAMDLPVEMRVQWLIPVLQKYRCVSISPQAAKAGRGNLFIAMGWDTDATGLDLDLSLVPLNKMKRAIPRKMVWYSQKTPRALSCGSGNYAMRSFVDDQDGSMPGDDELVKINLDCLNQDHADVEAVVVVVNVYKPTKLSWAEMDSAYLRIISGGQESHQHNNFFIHNADAVRTYVRLSGDDLKRDPELSQSGIAVGMFFRQPSGVWAFGALMRGMPGRNVQESQPHLEANMHDIVYPANTQWDQTQEHQQAVANGEFGEAGLKERGTVGSLVKNGELPCIASKSDQATLILGHMTPEALQNVQSNPKVPAAVKATAEKIQQGGAVANEVRKLAVTADKLEEAKTTGEREEIAKNASQTPLVPPTPVESQEAQQELDSLFDDI